MNYCHIHSQSYPLGCLCPYCSPVTITPTSLPVPAHNCVSNTGGKCVICGAYMLVLTARGITI